MRGCRLQACTMLYAVRLSGLKQVNVAPGTMTYGTSTWGLTEANYLVITLHLWTAFFGVRFWLSRPSQLLPVIQPYLPAAIQSLGTYLSWADFQWNHLVLIAMGGCSIQLSSQQTWRVLVQGEDKLKAEVSKPSVWWWSTLTALPNLQTDRLLEGRLPCGSCHEHLPVPMPANEKLWSAASEQ